jgi:hypothetical protein
MTVMVSDRAARDGRGKSESRIGRHAGTATGRGLEEARRHVIQREGGAAPAAGAIYQKAVAGLDE